MAHHTLLSLLLIWPAAVVAFSASTAGTSTATNIFEYLKWGGATPDFDVLEKTKE